MNLESILQSILQNANLLHVSEYIKEGDISIIENVCLYEEIQKSLHTKIEQKLLASLPEGEIESLLRQIEDYSKVGDDIWYYLGIKTGANLLKQLLEF